MITHVQTQVRYQFDPDLTPIGPQLTPILGALNEMVDYVSVNRGIVTEVIYPEGNFFVRGQNTLNSKAP